MNTLSILLYVANLISKVEVLMWMSVASSFFIFIVLFIYLEDKRPSSFCTRDSEDWDVYDKSKSSIYKGVYKLGVFITTLVLVVILVPSKGTMYLIAASEVGEDVVKSEEVREIKDVLLNVLQSYSKDK